MNRIATFAIGTVTILVLAGGAGLKLMLDHGFRAKDEPMALEKVLAQRMRYLAVPRTQGLDRNPVPLTREILAEARAHFADHCALCHGNDGRGISRFAYPARSLVREFRPRARGLKKGQTPLHQEDPRSVNPTREPTV